jgi:hypothetical protein
MISETSETKSGSAGLSPIQSQQVGEIHSDPAYAHDAVFGESTEEGPNYRNVCRLSRYVIPAKTDSLLGRMAWNRCPHDEDPDWPWCPLYSVCL